MMSKSSPQKSSFNACKMGGCNHLRAFIHHQRLAAVNLAKYTGKTDDELMDRLKKAGKALEDGDVKMCIHLLHL